MSALLWLWRHNSLDFELYDDLQQAIEDAAWVGYLETGVVHSIQTADEVVPADDPRIVEAEADLARVSHRTVPEKITHYKWRVDILCPDGSWQGFGWYITKKQAETESAEVMAVVGPDKLRFVEIFND